MAIHPLATALAKLALQDKSVVTHEGTPQKAAARLELGQQLRGVVATQLPGGPFRVQVAGQQIQMQLPAFIRSGDVITLQVTALQPRLTFSFIARDNPPSTAEALSAAARLLSSLSQQPSPEKPLAGVTRTVLWQSAAGQDTTALAQQLHHALSHSGLFYESHQAQWIAGQRSTPQLMLEPQNQPPPPPPALASSGAAASPDALLPEHLRPLVQQQLHALETHQVLWQGQVWEGQAMRWEVREDAPQRQAQPLPSGHWSSRIELDLPHLGKVSALLALHGDRISFHIGAASPATREQLQAASAQLVACLAERDLRVQQGEITLLTETAA